MYLNRRQELDNVTTSWAVKDVIEEVVVKWALRERDDGDCDDDDSDCSKSAGATATKRVCTGDDDDDDDDDCTSTSTTPKSTASSSVSKSTANAVSTTSTTPTITKATSASTSPASTTTNKAVGSAIAPGVTASSSLSSMSAVTTSSILSTSASAAAAVSSASTGISSSQSAHKETMTTTAEAIVIVLVVVGIIIVLPAAFFFIRRYLRRKSAAAAGEESPSISPLYRTSYSQGRNSGYFPDAETGEVPRNLSTIEENDSTGSNQGIAGLTTQGPTANSRGSTLKNPFEDPAVGLTEPGPVALVESPGFVEKRAAQSEKGMGMRNQGLEDDSKRQTLEIRPGGRWSDPFTTVPRIDEDGRPEQGQRWKNALSWVRDQRGRVNPGVRGARSEAGSGAGN